MKTLINSKPFHKDKEMCSKRKKKIYAPIISNKRQQRCTSVGKVPTSAPLEALLHAFIYTPLRRQHLPMWDNYLVPKLFPTISQ